MKIWLKRFAAGVILPGVLLLSACSGGTQNESAATSADGIQERTIKAGIGNSESHPQGQGMVKFKELLEEKSGGKMKVQNFFDATLGDDLKMTEALQGGLQEVTVPSTSPLVGMIKEFGIYDFPFVFNTEKEAYSVLDGAVGQKLLDKLPEHDLVGLGYWENGFRNLTNSKHPVNTAEDFKGLKIRTMQNEVHLEAFSKLGANPSPMAFSEVFTALESGTVDGQENPLATIKTQKYSEVQDYLSLTKHVYTPFVFLVSKKFWDSLSEEEQKIMSEAAQEAGEYQRALNQEENEKALKILEEEGMKINEVSPEEAEKMKEVIQPVTDEFAKKFGSDLVEEMMSEVEKVRGN
ncbi:TRAP transporter substrate-binding protein [Metabacillus sediminilitoris]|uniref:TRAP transporter substrate-binding protein n=1 Tax=Metabacillus sediminilitoris TaxID=2567941 RepID=A0A4V3WFB3_9BACI|nr:TRAP transporter substrate-binding protein [Metabacillus sediminilitoris]QGQ46146.1 DctP family TRAP transporter solute-binding subunit [Metabacillus sediminilitoris]THF79199.1 TRAP transporter substrate-binding protein [Metabacillus sediminilitoris]